MKNQITIWGGSGFIGSHVCDILTKNNFKVIVADKKKSKYLIENQKMFIGDITNTKDVLKSIKNSKYVYNFAGISDIEESNADPLNVVKNNISSNINLLECCKKLRVKKYIYASTIYVYSQYGGFYRCSKQSAELFIKEYNKLYNLNYDILRFGTVYGPRSDNRNAITRYIESAIKNKLINIKSKPDIIREYIHVHDIAKMCLEILNKDYDNKDLIFTGSHHTRINDLITLISEILNKKIKVKYFSNSKNSHYKVTPYSYQNQLSEKLNLNSSTDLGQGLLHLIHHLKKSKRNYDD